MVAGEHAELEEAVGRELGRMGVRGTLVLAGKSIELRAGGPPVSIDVEAVLGQWALLPPEMRARKAEEIARRLAGAHRASQAVGAPREVDLDAGAKRKALAAILGFFALLVVIGLARMLIPRLTAEPPPPPPPPHVDTARIERLARACDAVRDNIYRGAALGPMSLEGFVVELWLAKKGGAPLRESPALHALLSGKKLAPGADSLLVDITDGTAEITDGLDADEARRSPGWNAATLVLREGYARAFFDEEHHPRFVGLADRAATAAGAELGALYARCAHRHTHDVGAWFRGPDVPGAVAAMVYEMGFFADAKLIDRGALGAVRAPGGDLGALEKAAADAAEDIPRFVGTAGGAITGGPPATITFPLAGPVRAVNATHDMARRMGVAPATNE